MKEKFTELELLFIDNTMDEIICNAEIVIKHGTNNGIKFFAKIKRNTAKAVKRKIRFCLNQYNQQ